jgi:hypothetical protein
MPRTQRAPEIVLDHDKIDDAVLALLFLTLHDGYRAWKGFSWSAMNRRGARAFRGAVHAMFTKQP